MPKPGSAITEAVLLSVLVPDGDRVEEGSPLYVLETDKVEMEIEAPCAGVVSHVGTAGEVYRVGELIATIAEGRG